MPGWVGVVHVTLHMALRDVFENLTSDAVLKKCRLAKQVMQEGFGLAEPRIGVCALNPHAGEDGLFGDEELRIISPAVEQAHSEAIEVSGPFPTDTLMGKGARRRIRCNCRHVSRSRAHRSQAIRDAPRCEYHSWAPPSFARVLPMGLHLIAPGTVLRNRAVW